jgi:hypothetical protein
MVGPPLTMSVAGLPPDDETITGDSELWRRIPIWHWVADDSVPKGHRPSSAAFDEEEMSVVIAAECHGGLPTLLRGHEAFGVASFTVGDIRERGWGIVRAPDDQLPGHAHVLGKKTRGKGTSLAKKCHMLVDPRAI